MQGKESLDLASTAATGLLAAVIRLLRDVKVGGHLPHTSPKRVPLVEGYKNYDHRTYPTNYRDRF